MSPQDLFPSDAYPLTDAEATEVAIEAYVYASAIVQMEVHRRVLTNQDVSVREVVGPNFDTLYSPLRAAAGGNCRTLGPTALEASLMGPAKGRRTMQPEDQRRNGRAATALIRSPGRRTGAGSGASLHCRYGAVQL